MAVEEGSRVGGAGFKEWRFFIQVITGRWFMVFACLLIMSVSGATYIFGAYSNEVKKSMGYDQSTLNLLSFFKDLGGNVGVISGLINEITPPWVILAMGSVMNFFGYLMIWLAVSGHRRNTPIWQMCLFICIGANSQTFSNTGALVTCVMNFPESRGIVLGLLKGFVGLSGAIFSQLYHTFYGSDTKSLILFIAWLPAAVSCIFIRTVRIMKVRLNGQKSEVQVFYNLLYISLALAGFLMVLIVVQNSVVFTKTEYYASALVVTLLLFFPLYVVVAEELKLWRIKKGNLSETHLKTTTENPTPPHPTTEEEEEEKKVAATKAESPAIEIQSRGEKTEDSVSCFLTIFSPPERGEDYTILQAVFSIDMLTIFAATIAGVGGTLTAIDNLGQIGKALGYPARSVTTFVSLVSIWNYLGRVASGFTSEIFLTKYRVLGLTWAFLTKCYRFPRPAMLTAVLLLACVGHLLIAFGVPNSLYLASVIIGFCFGAQWPLIFAIISEIFGLKYYSTLYNMGGTASPIGAYILNVIVTGRLYDREARRQLEASGVKRHPGQELVCVGKECYKMPFLIIAGATVFASLVSFVLVLRTRKFYKGDIYKKFRGGANAA